MIILAVIRIIQLNSINYYSLSVFFATAPVTLPEQPWSNNRGSASFFSTQNQCEQNICMRCCRRQRPSPPYAVCCHLCNCFGEVGWGGLVADPTGQNMHINRYAQICVDICARHSTIGTRGTGGVNNANGHTRRNEMSQYYTMSTPAGA